MQLRFGIPLTIALMALTTYYADELPFNAFYIVVGTTTLWAAWDSRQLRVEQYHSAIALPPAGILAVFVLGWPIAFPWYLKLRYRIGKGTIGPRKPRSAIVGWVIIGTLATLYTATYLVTRRAAPALHNLNALANEIADEFHSYVNISVVGRVLNVSLVNARQLPPDSARQNWLRSVAIFAHSRYVHRDSIDSVSVQTVTQRERGAITFTETSSRSVWGVEQFGDTGRVSAEDDAFARSFLENVRSRNAAGEKQLQPASEISAVGWDTIRTWSSRLPNDRAVRLRLMHWRFLGDAENTRKLTYSIDGRTDTARVELWIVEQHDTRYVNTFRVAKPVQWR